MKKFINSTIPILGLSLLVSCGKALDQSSPGSTASPNTPASQDSEVIQNETSEDDGSNIDGFYAADLMPMNYNLHFLKVGAAGVERVGDQFSAYVKLQYGPKNVEHSQAVYSGRRCPNINDDLNKDAYIDIQEALVAIGQVVIPFDDNLDSQMEGRNYSPRGDVNTGKYFYERSASFSKLFSDLKTPDQDPDDNIMKLKDDEGLTFPGRVVLIQGASEKRELPKTVASFGSRSRYQTIPIACGILWKVKERPSELTLK